MNKIYNEECLQGMSKLADDSVDLIICDLPYGTTACSWDTIIPLKELWGQYKRVTKKDAAIVLFGAEPFSTLIRMSNLKQYKYDWYWVKNNATGFQFAKYQPMRSTETISVFCQRTPKYFPQGLVRVKHPKEEIRKISTRETITDKSLLGKSYKQEFSGYPNNVLKFPKEVKGVFHPTQKPVALIEYLVKTYSNPGELVLDNCMGSGTTAIACLNTDRQYVGYELNKEYYDQAIERIENNVTQGSLF